MKRIEMTDATASLCDYARRANREPVVVTRRGKAVAALVPFSDEDWEDLVVGNHPAFIALMRRSRARCQPGSGIPLEEVRRKYGIKPKAARKTERKAG